MYIDQINWKGEEYDIYSKEVENASTGVVDFDSEDSLNPSKFDDSVDLVESGETLSELCEKFSTTVKNVRYLGNLTGDTDISNIDSGTLTGAIQLLNETLYDSDGNIRLGTDDVGSEIQFIYLDKGKPTATTVATVGTSTKPIYINNGKFTESNATRGAWNRIMYMSSGSLVESDGAVGEDEKSLIYMKDGYFYKSGESVGSDGKTLMYLNNGTLTASSSTVGSGTQPVYLSSGTITALSTTVGSGTQPVYLSSGTITALSTTVGSGTKPIYSSSGTLTASSSTVGSSTTPVYLSSGTITALSTTVGSGTKPIYSSSGTLTASSSTVGSSTTPVYLSSGTLTACSYSIGNLSNYLPLSGGTLTGALNESGGNITITGSYDFVVQNGHGLYGHDSGDHTWTIARLSTSSKDSYSTQIYNNDDNLSVYLFGIGSDSSTSTFHNNYVVIGSSTGTREIQLRTGDSSRSGYIFLGVNTHCTVYSKGMASASISTSNAAPLYINSKSSNTNFGKIGLASSSIRYKDIVREITQQDIQELYNIPTYIFKYKKDFLDAAGAEDEEYDQELPGFIVEAWEKICPIAIFYKDGQPEMWNVNIVVPLMFEMIKNNHTLITELQEQIAQLTN